VEDDAQAPLPAERRLARLCAPFHNVTYYSPEISAFTTDAGMRGWWMAYFAYRSAPLGPVPVPVVVATFYGFAPAMVSRALPAAWDVLSPAATLDLRLELVDRALRRLLAAHLAGPELAEAAALTRRATEGCDLAGRALFAGHAALPWPDAPHLELWHACTLLREYRGDSHSLALAGAGVDGVECHVLMAAHGHGNRASILPIRGWTDDEWEAAAERLRARGWLAADGTLSAPGRAARAAIEDRTDGLCAGPSRRLGADGTRRLEELMEPWLRIFREEGGMPDRWPPPHLLRPDR
jgi:hypothetical protein